MPTTFPVHLLHHSVGFILEIVMYTELASLVNIPLVHFYHAAEVVLATVPVLDLAGNISLRGNGLTPSKIDDFLSEPSLQGHKY
jgi:hypothetical protein